MFPRQSCIWWVLCMNWLPSRPGHETTCSPNRQRSHCMNEQSFNWDILGMYSLPKYTTLHLTPPTLLEILSSSLTNIIPSEALVDQDHTVLPATHTSIHEWNEPSPSCLEAEWRVEFKSSVPTDTFNSCSEQFAVAAITRSITRCTHVTRGWTRHYELAPCSLQWST